jgi:hypothetical protein
VEARYGFRKYTRELLIPIKLNWTICFRIEYSHWE